MKRLYIEQEFEHRGLPCVVIMTYMGHRCGYVGVPENHPLHGVSMGDEVFPLTMLPDYEEGRDYYSDMVSPMIYFDVHGGITYSEHDSPDRFGKPGMWWYGYDCMHDGDARELDHPAVDESTRRVERDFPSHGVVRTLEYCVAECKKLAEQLHELQRIGWTIPKEASK